MKIFLQNRILFPFFLSLLVLAAAMGTDKSMRTSKSTFDINLDDFKKIFFKKESVLDRFLDTLIVKTKGKSIRDLIRINYPVFKETLDKNGLAVFIYEADSLKFWSDNTIPVINKYSGSTFSNKVVFLQNAWYKVLHKTDSNRIVIGLMLIKHKYQYENEFLKNEFHHDFGVPAYMSITQDSTTAKYNIRDVNNNYLFSLQVPVASNQNVFARSTGTILYILGFCLLIFSVIRFFAWASINNKKVWLMLILLGASIIILRFFSIQFMEPSVFYTFPLFDPQFYAHSFFFPSLGDFLINALCIFFFCYILYKIKTSSGFIKKNKIPGTLILILSLIIIDIFFTFNHYMFDSLILNSSISFEVYKVFDLSIFTVIGFFIIALLFASLILISDKLIMLFKELVSIKQFIIYFIISLAILSVVTNKTDILTSKIYPFVFIFIIVSALAIVRYKNYRYNYYLVLLIVFLASIYIVYYVVNTTFEKEKNIRKVLVVNLANERDLVAELLLQDISPKLKEDKAVKNYLHMPYTNHKDMQEYIQKEYFKGYWNKYNLKTFICTVRDSSYLEPDYKMSHCYSYFGDQIEKYGILIPKTSFYFLDNVNGRINYLGVMKYKIYANNLRVTLYIEMTSKLVTEELGYPELLLDKKLYKKSNIGEYSYAKYRNNQLLSQIGTFRYNLSAEFYSPKSDEFNFIDFEGYSHLLYIADSQNIIILSRPQLKMFDLLISLSYIFVFFFILTNIILFITSLPLGFMKFSFNMQARIQISMISLLLLSMLLVGGGTIYYNIQQYQNKTHESIREKIQSVVKELENDLGNEFELTSKLRENINTLLTKLATVFNTDINLYDTRGNLLGTSRPEVFEKGLIGTKINIEAYNQLLIYKKAEFIHSENISSLSYQSAYVPLKNNNGRLLAYLNLPYFTKQTALRKELTSFVAAIFNIYVLLVLLSILIAIFISNKLTQPLVLIQRKLRETTLGKKNEQIEYSGKDEIGNLIKEYNRMVEELTQSALLLAKSERETAWREMAKQIAHEIKNPLTPMKLSIQYLQRVWNNKSPDKEEVMEKVTKTLIEQIDALSAIATEFSNFAKMPKPFIEKLNIGNIASTCAQLFLSNENIKIEVIMSSEEPVFILADKEQMLRVFNNLIKNAVQAIPEGKSGIIGIRISLNNNKAVIEVKDNGTGISEKMAGKIFEPNFTTKTSGMGLGLSIVKSIIENMDGSINYKTEHDTGTTFIIELPANF